MKKSYMVKVCPNCGSTNIDYASLEEGSGKEFLGIGLPEKYYCKDCGYTGSVILEVDRRKLKDIKFKKINFKKQHKEKSKVKKKKHEVRNVELMKPVFVLTVLFFLLTSLVFLSPVVKSQNQQGTGGFIQTSITQTSKTNNQKNNTNPYTQYEKTDVTKVKGISNALGIESAVGFLTPLFFLFFTIALVILGLSAHWERIKIFE